MLEFFIILLFAVSVLISVSSIDDVGSHVVMVGEVLSAGTAPVANIYSGTSYVLAYIPENYLFDVDKGQKVSIKGRGRTATGYIERVLPVPARHVAVISLC